MANILITTTPILGGGIEIERYLGPLTANVVLGVNVLSEFTASFTDVFGGNSETYQSKLDILNKKVREAVTYKATRAGANAIIDYKLQFNEITGKGKQMFMVTATGTACIISMTKQKEETLKLDTGIEGTVSFNQIKREYLITRYREILLNEMQLNEEKWDNIFSFNLSEILPELTREYFRLKSDNTTDLEVQQYKKDYFKRYDDFMSTIDTPLAIDSIYPYLETHPDLSVTLIIKNNLFDPSKVIEQLEKGQIKRAVNLLASHKEFYTKDDLDKMQAIVRWFDSLPDKGSIQTVKTGLFSKKEEEMYFCPEGHKNPIEELFCLECGLNMKGLTRNQMNIINQFRKITEILVEIL